MTRSSKKSFFVDVSLFEKVKAAIASGSQKPIKTWSRRSMITPDFVGLTFSIHNGRKFIDVYITENLVGHKLGEFAMTGTFKAHNPHTQKA